MTNAVNLASAAGTGFSFRNRLINGDMRINQRGSASVSTDGAFPVDRWLSFRQAGSYAAQQSTDVPTGQGFQNSLLWSPANTTATNYSGFEQRIEGFNVADLHWGTTNAKPVTVSFWVKVGVAGTFNFALRNTSGRSYCATYTVNQANTWEYKSVTVAGDTTGTWPTDASNGLGLWFSTGGTQQQAGNAWSSTGYLTATGTTQIYSAPANFWLTGVQLEVGTVATTFEERLHGLELLLCQRYLQKFSVYPVNSVGYFMSYYGDTAVAHPVQRLSVPMRATPSASFENASVQYYSYGGVWTNTTLTITVFTNEMYVIGAASDGDGRGKLFRNGSSGTAPTPHVFFNAEL